MASRKPSEILAIGFGVFAKRQEKCDNLIIKAGNTVICRLRMQLFQEPSIHRGEKML